MLKRSRVSYVLMILLGEKVVQHVVVSAALLFNVGGIRASVAVGYEVLMISGAIVAVLFAVALRWMIGRRGGVLRLVAVLAAFDIVGEFVAQGTVFITVNVSILVAFVLLVLSYLEYRKIGSVEAPLNHSRRIGSKD